MQARAMTFVVVIVRQVAVEVGKAVVRIATGRPANPLEAEIAETLRDLIQRLVNKSRLMNPGVP